MIEQTDKPTATHRMEQDRSLEVEQPLTDDLNPDTVPSRVSVYDRPQRRVSPIMIGVILILLLIAAYFLYQLIV